MGRIEWSPAPPMVRWSKLKSLRRERNLTQPQVAVGADLALATITKLEAGFEDRTTDLVKQKLAKFFCVDVADIFPTDMIGDRPRVEVMAELMKQPRRATAAKAPKKN